MSGGAGGIAARSSALTSVKPVCAANGRSLLGDQAHDELLSLFGQRVIGGAHVGEFGLGAARAGSCAPTAASSAPTRYRNELSVCHSWLASE